MKVVILAGGLGTRLQEETSVKPKPMVEIGNHPIVWHIMKIYATYGLKEFMLALGYKGEWIKKYFLNYHYLNRDFSVDLQDGNVHVHSAEDQPDWRVHLVDTGVRTQTGGRLKRLVPWIGQETFMMTYGDGLANVDISKLLAFHQKHGKLATLTIVRPPARFGAIALEGARISQFVEKPQIGEGWANGGFFVLEPEVLDYVAGDETLFEREPLEQLSRDGQLMAYRHDGFWQCMDTLRDVRLLENLWQENRAPWKIW